MAATAKAKNLSKEDIIFVAMAIPYYSSFGKFE
jgi:hypothetical protein